VDNPIGKASAYSLIDIQMKVARQLGIQLLYTTGLNDDGPLSQFKRVVRMRNDHNLRNGLQHVHLDEDYQRALDVVSDSEHAGHVRAVAVSFPAQAA
jgi:hypothetical protein